MMRFATAELLPQLKKVWQVCFQEEDAYVEFAFNQIIQPENVMIYAEREGPVQAMLCVQPAVVTAPDGLSCNAAYIYGVATLPEAQGKGLSTKLLKEANKQLKRRGMHLSMLVPASESLFDFYGKRDYEPGFSINKVTVLANELEGIDGSCHVIPSALDQLEDMRNAFYGGSCMFVRWDRRYLGAINAECRLSGGEVLRLVCGPHQGYAVCYRYGGKIVIKELAVPEPALQPALASLHRRFGAEEYLVYLPADRQTKFTNAVLPFALVRWYDRKMKERFTHAVGAAPYLVHVLD